MANKILSQQTIGTGDEDRHTKKLAVVEMRKCKTLGWLMAQLQVPFHQPACKYPTVHEDYGNRKH
jgi:hypothetical protein